jgi:ribosomal protein S18 acetylase RimI-like enzyme
MQHVELFSIERRDELPAGADPETLFTFFHEKMKPYHDTRDDVARGLEYAFDPARGGFLVLAMRQGELVGGLVMLFTRMSGYIPPNLLLFVAVEPSLRGRGLGRRLIEHAAARCEGDIKLHVEPDNPAMRLYQRAGFETKYLEMRWSRK